MGYDIVKDLEKGVAVLVDAVNGRALGPLETIEGDAHEAERIMEAFVGALGVDPSTLPIHKLEARWEQFLAAVHGETDAPPPDVASAPPRPVDPGQPPETVTPSEHTEPEPVEAGHVAVDPGAAIASAPAPGPVETTVPSEPEPRAPGAQAVPTAGQTRCPTCDGFGTVAAPDASGVVVCPACLGSGVADAT